MERREGHVLGYDQELGTWSWRTVNSYLCSGTHYVHELV